MYRLTAGEKLRKLREERGESTRRVSDNLGISESSLIKYERDERTPRDEVKIKLAEYYDVRVEKIFFTS